MGLLLDRTVSRDGVTLADLPYNRQLVAGPDLGGTAAGGLYRPAARRYRGRFYAELGEDAPEILMMPAYPVLVISGLYGLLTPAEPIQAYSCHVNDHVGIRDIWTREDLLTNIIAAYMQSQGVTHLVDMTAEVAYRTLVAWEPLRRKAQVVHCFGEQNAGPALLRALAYVFRHYTASDPDETANLLARPGVETPYERVLFSAISRPPAGAPHEAEFQDTIIGIADKFGRMRRNIIRVLRRLEGNVPTTDGVTRRIDRMTFQRGRLPADVASAMREIVRLRNNVEYQDYVPTSIEFHQVQERYKAIERLGRNLGVRGFERV
jgi:hypothetical protein